MRAYRQEVIGRGSVCLARLVEHPVYNSRCAKCQGLCHIFNIIDIRWLFCKYYVYHFVHIVVVILCIAVAKLPPNDTGLS